MTRSRFHRQRRCQRGRQADTHRPPPKELGIWVLQLPKLLAERPQQSAPGTQRTEEEEAAKGMWCAISAAIGGKGPCQLGHGRERPPARWAAVAFTHPQPATLPARPGWQDPGRSLSTPSAPARHRSCPAPLESSHIAAQNTPAQLLQLRRQELIIYVLGWCQI